MDSFWPSTRKQDLLDSHNRSSISPLEEHPTVIGQVTMQGEEWQCLSIHNGEEIVLPHLQSHFEGGSFRIPIYVLDCLENGHRIWIVIASDTDAIVALLYHMPIYKTFWSCG